MNRQKILIAACVLASISIGTNVWWLMGKKERDAAAQGQPAAPALPTASNFDFTDTAFEDGTWKLDDVEKPRVPKMTPEGEPAGPGYEELQPDASERKEKPVYGGSGLGDESWRLGDGKKKETPPTVGPPRSEAPPAPAPPQEKSTSRGAVFQGSDFDGTAFADGSWRLTDVSEDEESAVVLDTAFHFEGFSDRCPVTWEMEGYFDYRDKFLYSGPPRYFHPEIRTLTGSYEPESSFRPRDTASLSAVRARSNSEMDIR